MEIVVQTCSKSHNNKLAKPLKCKLLFKKRTYKLPWWIKAGTILFLFTSHLIPIVLILSSFNFKLKIALYGFQTSNPTSKIGLLILLLFALKGIVAFGIFKEKIWAFRLGIIDSIIGIIICILQFGIIDLVANSTNITFEFRLEILILIPYLIYLSKNKKSWSKMIRHNQ